jgi:hypothetical protein
MTLSKNNAKQIDGSAVSGWPMLQSHLNLQELIFPNDKVIKQFKNLGDIIPTSMFDKYSVKSTEKLFVIFFKGKLYKFKNVNSEESNC